MAIRLPVLVLSVILLLGVTKSLQGQEASVDLDAVIRKLNKMKDSPHTGKYAVESAIDALSVLREFPPSMEARKDFQRPLEIVKLQHSTWKLPADETGFQQTIRLANSTGSWQRSRETKPFGFNWLIIPGKFRISYVSGTQIVDRTYKYKVSDDNLVLIRNNERLTLSKWIDQKLEPENGG